MNKRIVIIGLTLLLASIFLTYYLTNNKSATDKNILTLKIPDTKFMGLLPLYVADEKGFFKENGISISWVDVKDPGQAEKAFLSGSADLNATTFANLLSAEIRTPGTLQLFIPTYESSEKPGSYLLVNSDSKINSVADLKGKKIGTYSGPSQKAYAIMVMNKIGLQIDKDYELVQVTSSAQLTSLFAKNFDVLFAVEPYGSQAIIKGAKKIEDGVRTKYIQNPFWVGAFEVKKEFSKDSTKMNMIIKSMQLAINYIKNNEVEARQILLKRTNIDESVSKTCFLYNWEIKPNENQIQEMNEMVKLLFKSKMIEKEIEINSLLYNK